MTAINTPNNASLGRIHRHLFDILPMKTERERTVPWTYRDLEGNIVLPGSNRMSNYKTEYRSSIFFFPWIGVNCEERRGNDSRKGTQVRRRVREPHVGDVFFLKVSITGSSHVLQAVVE
uniref:Uncharacterized protein n=1 Tax=Octopus bimaculoides TaxID=37653 RepID=A0A0L8FYM0_OCTBM